MTKSEIRTSKRLMEETITPVERYGGALDNLRNLFNKGAIDVQTYNRAAEALKNELPEVVEQQRRLAEQMERGRAITERVMTPTERYKREVRDLKGLLNVGAVDQRTYTRELERLKGTLPEIQERQRRVNAALQEQADMMRRGLMVTRSVENAQERYSRELAELNALLRQGAISQETFNRAQLRARQQLQPATQQAGGAAQAMGMLQGRVAGLHPALLAATVVTAGLTAGMLALRRAARAVGEAVANQFQEIDKIGKMSSTLGMAANELIVLRKAGVEFSGMAEGQVDMALQRMTRRIAEAAAGTGEAAGTLKQLGLNAQQLRDSGPSEAFKLIADRIQAVQSPAERLRIAFKLFDSEGARLVTTLGAGRRGLEQMEEKARELGLTITDLESARIQQANDRLTDAKDVMVGLARTIAVELAPSVTALGQTFIDTAEDAMWWTRAIKAAGQAAVESAFMIDASGALGDVITEGLIGAVDANLFFGRINAFRENYREVMADVPEITRQTSQAVVESQLEMEEKLQSVTSSLREQIATFGMSSRQIEIWRLQQQGAKGEVLQTAIAMSRQLDAMERQKKALEEQRQAFANFQKQAFERGKQLMEEFKSPIDKFADRMRELNMLFRIGAIDARTFGLAKEGAMRDAQSALASDFQRPEFGANTAILRGSAEAFSLQANQRRESMFGRHFDEMQKKQVALLERIANNTAQQPVQLEEMEI